MPLVFKRTLIFLISSLAFQNLNAQLGFCGGNSGDPIFIEDFGSGTTPGPALAPGITTYNFTAGEPNDGSYTIASSSANFFDWHNTNDHTPGDTDGKMLIVNASFNPGEFYKTSITGLCENTSYEFSAFLLNFATTNGFCGSGLIPVNVKFQIWDDSDTTLLASGDTGDLFGTSTATWTPYGLVFRTEPGQTSVILKMINNGSGGCGNDLAIDDITFKSCGDFIELTNTTGDSNIAQCEDEGVIVSTTITATPDNSIFNSHFYQWQESVDGMNWTDIAGETTNSYTTPTILDVRFFRVKVAEDLINVSNALCNVVSEPFRAILLPFANAPLSAGDVSTCADLPKPIIAMVPDDEFVNWYDAPVGGNLLQENSASFFPTTPGIYYAAASSTLVDCFSLSRTPIAYTVFDLPELTDEEQLLCENTSITLSSNLTNVDFEWSTGETTSSIQVDTPGEYNLEVTNINGCSATKVFKVIQIEQPEIESIVSDDENIIVTTLNEGFFEYALDNGPFQDSPVFELVEGGLYTVKIRGINNCPEVSQEFIHFVIPKFFTPNGDLVNDLFLIQGLQFFDFVNIQIYDRYGNLLKQSNENTFSWDGTFNNKMLPSSDYWYAIQANNQIYRGHFSMKR